MNEIHGKAPLNNSAKWGRGGALAIGTMTSQSTPQPITGPLLARAPGLQPRLAQWLMRPWLGRYRHTSSSRQIHNIFCWLEILNYCPDGGNGNFHCSSSFLKAISLICEAQLSFAAHQKYILWFFSLWWMIKGIWTLFSLPFIFLWNRKPRLDNFMFIITLEC